MKITVTYFFQRVCGIDKVTYANKDLVMCYIESVPSHRMDTGRIFAYGSKEASNIEQCKLRMESDIRNRYYVEDADRIDTITFIDNCDYALPHKPYFAS